MSASREKRKRQQAKADGTLTPQKKKQRNQDAFRRTVAIVFASVVLFAIVLLLIAGSGIMQASLNALDIGGVKISAAEYDFHYYLSYYQTYSLYESHGMLDYLNIDSTKSLKSQNVSDDQTWAEYFGEMAVESLQSIVMQSEQAKKEGITLTERDYEQIDSAIASVESSAASNGYKTERFLKLNYGRGITLESYRSFLERSLLAERYATATKESYVRTDEDLENFYSENKTDYDYVDYHTFTISGTPPAKAEGEEDYTEEELAAFKEEQRALADKMLARVTASDTFFALSKEYTVADGTGDDTGGDDTSDNGDSDDDSSGDDASSGDEDGTDEEETADAEADTTLKEKVAAADLSESISEFLLEDGRKTGDKTVVEDGDDFLVLLFLNRYRDEEKTVNIRHILISLSDYETSEEAKARAEELLEEWKNGAATEDSFAALAEEHSTDGGSNTNGGLYENVYQGQMLETFNDWCFDPSRKPGDTGIVETEHGFHIMYFSGDSVPLWKSQVKTAMETEDYQALLDSLAESFEVKSNWFGMLFTKTKL